MDTKHIHHYILLPPFLVTPLSVGLKVTMQRGVIWPRDSLLPGVRGSEPREREREREGQGLKYPSVRLGMI
jgi:hypothetical protein